MNAIPLALPAEHLNPHDLVTYSRCPHEMELGRARRASVHSATPVTACTPPGVVPLRHSPMFAPPLQSLVVNEGPLDVFPGDHLVYLDEGEANVPMLFAPEQIVPEPALRRHGVNLLDDELGISERPDLVVRRANADLFPVEYKATHLFPEFRSMHPGQLHGRRFDVIQSIAECRLVHAATGQRPKFGVIWYGDQAGGGAREGWVQVPYGDPEERWLRAALVQVRSDHERAPVPAEWNCAPCEPNREGMCRFAGARPDSVGHPSLGPR